MQVRPRRQLSRRVEVNLRRLMLTCLRLALNIAVHSIHPDRTRRLDSVARYLQDLGFDNLEANGAAQTHPPVGGMSTGH